MRGRMMLWPSYKPVNMSYQEQQLKFKGNPEDLEQFLRLAGSRVRSDERETALQSWEDYKLKRQYQQLAHLRKMKPGRYARGGTKRAYIQSLHVQAIDLRGVCLERLCVGYADFRGVRFDKAILGSNTPEGCMAMKGARLANASLRNATLFNALLKDADLSNADMHGATMINANLQGANLAGADLSNADLQGANLEGANLVKTNLTGANISGCRIYGIAAWDIEVDDKIELRRDLILTPEGQPEVKVDSIEVAQFVYLLLNNTKIRNVINSVCNKAVLILGRFAESQRKAVLDGLREKLRQFDLLPIVFDFDRPIDKDYTETIQTLAGLSMFVIADITNPKSAPLELEATVKQFKIPYVPIIDISVDPRPFAMLVDSQKSFHWVLPTLQYQSMEDLLDDENLKEYIIDPVNKKHEELRKQRMMNRNQF